MFKTQCALALIALYVGLAHSWDIAVSMGDQLQFYTNATKTETVHFISQNLSVLAYDEVHNMLLYVDKQSNNDAICGFNLSTMEYKYITERNGRNIHGLAFDSATELLFFSDLNEKSINWFSLKPGAKNNFYGNLLIKMDEGVPTDLAVDSCRGYIYWMNTQLTTPRIERARFDGSDREVVINLTSVSINTTYTMEPHSLAIDQETQKMFWIEPEKPSEYITYSADLNGKNKLVCFYFRFKVKINKIFTNPSNVLTVSNTSLISWIFSKAASVWEVTESKNGKNFKKLFTIETEIPIGVAANYKIGDQVRRLTNCDALTSLVQKISVNNDSLKIAKEYEGPFCVNGTKGNAQSRCQCRPGYVGERCDVSVCMNYCSHGTCRINDERLPTCSCNAGYSGERCDFNSCHDYCLNNGDCTLDEEDEPVCRCKGSYVGDRCEVSTCLNYCMQGNCSINEEGLPTCSCNAGYSGERCDFNSCHDYCLNNGDCTLDVKDEPVCRCKGSYVGDRCEVSTCLNYCMQGNCSFNEEGLPTCSCNTRYTGRRCEVDACHSYCMNDGECSLDEEDEPVCQCGDNHEGSRCEAAKAVSDTAHNITQYSNASTFYSTTRNLTLADLLTNWRKPSAKITVTVEV